MQRSNLIIMPLVSQSERFIVSRDLTSDQSQVFASFLTGTLASYEQNPAMYGTFTLINGMLGASVFFFHCTGNERVTLTLTHVHCPR